MDKFEFLGIIILIFIFTLCMSSQNPDLRQLEQGDWVSLTYDLSKAEGEEQMLRPPCENGTVQLIIFNEQRYWEKYDHSVQVCYDKKVDCKKKVKVEGVLGKFRGKCSKGSQNKTCDYYYVKADEITCL